MGDMTIGHGESHPIKDLARSLCTDPWTIELRKRNAEIERLKAEVERLARERLRAVYEAHWYNAAKRLSKWRDLCLDGIADLKLSLAVFEQGAVVDAKLINNLEAERDAAEDAARMAEERVARLVTGTCDACSDGLGHDGGKVYRLCDICFEEGMGGKLKEARAEAERLQGYLDEECRLRREAQYRSAELDALLTEAWLDRDEARDLLARARGEVNNG